MPAIIKGLQYIRDLEMAGLMQKADKIYQKNKIQRACTFMKMGSKN